MLFANAAGSLSRARTRVTVTESRGHHAAVRV